jgi:hypothetical protein
MRDSRQNRTFGPLRAVEGWARRRASEELGLAGNTGGLVRARRWGPGEELTSVAGVLAFTRLVLGDVTTYEQVLGHEGTATRE